MLTEDDLTRSLAHDAARASLPTPGLLERVEHREVRLRRRSATVASVSALLLVGAGLATGLAVRASPTRPQPSLGSVDLASPTATLDPVASAAASRAAAEEAKAGAAASAYAPSVAAGTISTCSSPAQPLKRYYDWPCTSPNPGTTRRVAVALAAWGAYAPHTTPEARLLADTDDDGSSLVGPGASLVEIWTPTRTDSAVFEVDDQHLRPFEIGAGVIFSNDPRLFASGGAAGDGHGGFDFLVYAARGIDRVRVGSQTVDVHGGVAVLTVTGSVDPSEPVVGLATDGSTVAATTFEVNGCAKGQTTPCNAFATPSAHH